MLLGSFCRRLIAGNKKPRFPLLWPALLLACTAAAASLLKSDEEIILFPTSGDLAAGQWRLPLHLWVFERELESAWRGMTVEALANALGLEPESAGAERFRQRAWPFLVDNERGKRLTVRAGERQVEVGLSGANGHTLGKINLAYEQKGECRDRWVELEVVPPPGDERRFRGKGQLLCPEGMSVISDIDDTIKISEVLDRQALLRNTFVEPFQAVPGMAALYRRWSEAGAHFHYVSGSPWQLYPVLAAFLDEAGYPPGSFHLRPFRLKGRSLLQLFASAEEYKLPIIDGIFRRYPGCSFILVGDSGQWDPEVYGEMARRYPAQVEAILIRDITGEPPRGETLCRGLCRTSKGAVDAVCPCSADWGATARR